MLAYRKTSLSFLGAVFALCPPIFPQCVVPGVYQQRLDQLPGQMTNLALYRTKGLLYLELKCTHEARVAFDQAMALSKDNEVERARVSALRDLASGYEQWTAQDIPRARKTFLSLADEVKPPEVSTQAAFALAEMLMQYPDASTWEQLEPELVRLDTKRNSWQARRYRLLHGLDQDNGAVRVQFLEGLLAAKSGTQDILTNEIILADVLRRTGRTTEAWLIVNSIDREAGRKLLSPELRLLYIQVTAGIASVLSRNGDSEATKRYQSYISALREIDAEKQIKQ